MIGFGECEGLVGMDKSGKSPASGQGLTEPEPRARRERHAKSDRQARLAAVDTLEAMRLPVGPVEDMIAESVPDARDLPG